MGNCCGLYQHKNIKEHLSTTYQSCDEYKYPELDTSQKYVEHIEQDSNISDAFEEFFDKIDKEYDTHRHKMTYDILC